LALKLVLRNRAWRLVLACPILAAALILLAPGLLARQEMAVFDLYESRVEPPPAGERFVVILARERTLREIQGWPFPRRLHAQLLKKLDGAKLVVLDAIFPQPTSPVDDRRLAEAAREAGNVIGAGLIMFNEATSSHELSLPYKELSAELLDYGMVNVDPDPDGIARDYRMMWPLQGGYAPSLPLAIFQRTGREVAVTGQDDSGYDVELPAGRVRLPLDFDFKVHHPAQGPAIFEYVDVLSGLVPPEAFKGAVVIVGVNVGGALDYFPIGRGRIIPGSVYVADAAMTLLHGWIPHEAGRLASLLAAALMALGGAILAAAPPRASRRLVYHWALWLAALVAAWLAASYGLFMSLKIWLAPLQPALSAVASFGLVLAARSRLLASEWQIQRLSVESVLFLGRLDFSAEMTSFPDYLEKNWPEIERWSAVSLISAWAPADDAEIQAALKRLPSLAGGSGQAADLLESTVVSARSGVNRLFLALPEMESGAKRYAVLGWAGRRSPETLKSVVAMVLTAAMHFKALEEYRARRELFTGLIKIIIGAMDAKDPTTAGHSNRVAELSRELAANFGLSAEEVENIYLGGLLHDVGKLGIPDSILNKPGRLSDEEMDVIRRHPRIGNDLMRQVKLPSIIMQSIFEHHEKLDGTGYPNRIDRRQLSLAGRILKIADVFDALISKRQYKDPMPLEKVYSIIREGAGAEFDEELVRLLMEKPFQGPGLAEPAEAAAKPSPGPGA
jgi:putative nucleotidyltransferase with HDIG domain